MPHSCMKDSWHGWEGLVEGEGYVSDFPIQGKDLLSSNKLLSEPGLLSKPSLGSKDSLTPSNPETAEPPFICGTAHFWGPQEKKQVKLCTLAFVQNSWLPVQRRAVVCNIPCRRLDSDATLCEKQDHPQKHSSKNKEMRHPDERDLGKESRNLMGFRTSICPVEESSKINQAAGKENITSQKNNLQLSQGGLCKEWEEAPRISPLLSGGIRLDDPGWKGHMLLSANCPHFGTQSSQLLPVGNARPAEVESAGSEAKMSFSSITITSRKVSQGARAALRECPNLDPMTLPDGGQPSPTYVSHPSTGEHTPANCNGQASMNKEKASNIKMIDERQSFHSAHRVTEFRHSFTKGENKYVPTDSYSSSTMSSTRGPFRSCAYLEVPARYTNSFLYFTWALSVSLTEGRLDAKAKRPDVYRSTLHLHVQSNSIRKAAPNSHIPLRTDPSARPKRPLSCSGVMDLALDPDITILPLAQCGSRLPICIFSTDPDVSAHTSSSELPLGNLSDSSRRNAKRVGIANEDTCLCWRSIRGLQATISTTKVVDAGNHRRTAHLEPGARRGGPHRVENTSLVSRSQTLLLMESYEPRSYADPKNTTLDDLTLREALELFRPEFISRSQDRVKQLEQRAQERRTGQSRGPALEAARGHHRRNCTKPHPLSDNLHKPRERAISGKEMQRRSKRIYNNLPEVTKKKDEERKKTISEINRQRAELFKKKLLDQILQRNSD
ncbi:hypothetical protein GN956_G11730 [Arapaima gigas]